MILVASLLFGTGIAHADDDAVPSPWSYGAFADGAYLYDFNRPANHLFRSRGTTFHVDTPVLDMAGVFARKPASATSRWGMELTIHGGKDSELFGFSATAPNIRGYRWLRHLGPTNVSYLTGSNVTLQAGIFNSFIGYDSLYAKDNFAYTRPWGADFTPYLMMGVNASRPIHDRSSAAAFIVNGYWHLADANSAPSGGGQLAYKASDHTTIKETLLIGPHQSNTSTELWRYLSDSIIEWKSDRFTSAFEVQYSTERVDAPGTPRALWMSAQVPLHWVWGDRWSTTLRPEYAWDRDGRWTLARQRVKAFTTTLEYRAAHGAANAILRLEHRYDESRGPEGGFFNDGFVAPGVVGLKPGQHLLIFAAIFTFDSPAHK